jgi:hypothetical protein
VSEKKLFRFNVLESDVSMMSLCREAKIRLLKVESCYDSNNESAIMTFGEREKRPLNRIVTITRSHFRVG